VSLAGRSHASRAGASLLAQAGLEELAATDEEAFLRAAIGLANDPQRRRELRSGLRARLRASPLLDAARFARSLESAYGEMWRAYAEWQDPLLRLHIGGQQKMPRWKIVHPQPGPDVDYVADAADLGRFGEGKVDEIYAANLYDDPPSRAELGAVLRAFHRALKPGGTARISVPDAEALEPLLRDPGHTDQDLEQLLLVAYGPREEGQESQGWGQGAPGLTFAGLERLLREAGFAAVERVRDFGLFHDASRRKFNGLPLTVNVVARK
jgi:predicted SAM-dependent methyltransferase